MDQRGGCCIARYAGGAYDTSKVDRIMLRFRPIAPKPASTDGSASGGRCSSSTTPENSGGNPHAKTGRGKRRYVAKDGSNGTVNKRNNGRKRKSVQENTDSGGSVTGGEKHIKTLPLLPEAPDVKEAPKVAPKQRFPLWLSFENGGGGGGIVAAPSGLRNPMTEMGRRVVVGSWVRVECVTDTWLVDCYLYGGIGRTDEERMRSLDADTCPGFVSDDLNRVRWTNAAYRQMVAGEGAAVGEVAAWVVVEEGVALPVGCAAFTCKVRVVTCGKDKTSKTVLCDVWRMDCGGFAWRLDTTAALSLWIGN